MALAFGAIVLDGQYTKICTITCLDNDGAGNLAVDYTTNLMTDFVTPGFTTPTDARFVVTTSPDTANSTFGITASTATGFTINKFTGGGGANPITVRVTTRIVHSIDR